MGRVLAELQRGKVRSLEAEAKMATTELAYRKAQHLAQLSTSELRDLHESMKAALEVIAQEVIQREVAEKVAAKAAQDEDDKQVRRTHAPTHPRNTHGTRTRTHAHGRMLASTCSVHYHPHAGTPHACIPT